MDQSGAEKQAATHTPPPDQALQDWREITDLEAEQATKTASATSTSWTLISDAINDDSATSEQSKSLLAKRYWHAVFAYIRASGRSMVLSEDLTQGFFCDVFLGRNLLNHAQSARGRFRSLLLSSVRNYLSDDFRMKTAKRRMPEGGSVTSLDNIDGMMTPSDDSNGPELAFNRIWVEELIARTQEQVKLDMTENGQSIHWEIFQDRVLEPCQTGCSPTPHEDLANAWGLNGIAQVSNMLVTAKRRFARQLLENVRETIPENYSPSTELDELFQALGN